MDLAIFESRPGVAALLKPDAPIFTVVTISNDFEIVSGLKRADAIGRGHLELFPQNPDDKDFTGEKNLRSSFEAVLLHKKPHQLPLQRYDVQTADQQFSVRYWRVSNVPVLDVSGEVQYIIHTAEDITPQILAEQQTETFNSIKKTYNLFMNAPVIIGVLRNDNYVIEMANEGLLEVWGRKEDVIGKPLVAAIPELKEQGFIELLESVRITGKPFYAYSYPITLQRFGKEEILYFDFVYKPFYEEGNKKKADGIISVGYDVTAQVIATKEIELAKKEAESQKRLYETINGSTPDLIYVFGLDYRFVYANKALLTMWGKTWDDAIGKTLLENGYEPWHAEMHEREIDHVVAKKEPIRGEVSFPHATLGKRIYDYIFVPVFDSSGNVEAVAGTTRDITEIRRAQESVVESNERFKNLADESPMFVFIIDPEPNAPVHYWNKTWLQYTGQSLEEAVGRAWDGILHADDVAIAMENYSPAFESKQPYIIDAVRVKRYDGDYRWHMFKGNPRYQADGTFNGFVGVGFDIHEQKLAQEALKQSEMQLQEKIKERTQELQSQKNLFDNILKNSSNGITLTEMIRDENGNIIDAKTILANDAAVRSSGLTMEQFLSYTAKYVDPDIMNSEYGKRCLATLATGQPSLSQYYIEMTGRWQELTISKMDDDHLIHIFTDITPIKHAQQQLEKTIEELTRSNANLEEFAYAASHDLKEPIRKINIFSDRLKSRLNDKLDEEERSFFHRMDMAAGRMSTLIDDLLQYSYVSKGGDIQEQVDLNKLIKVVLEDLDLEIEQKNAKISVKKLPVINGHKRQLQQLLQNLISNALKYTAPGVTPQISIDSRLVEKDDVLLFSQGVAGSHHLITIKDNGIGFLQSDADRIFKVFTRLHSTAEYKGSGVGLSIVRKVVDNHHGKIWAEGAPGEGAIFKILLPA